jgi:hypothetical protein
MVKYNFDLNREIVVERFGEFNYRRFRLYPWARHVSSATI